MSNVYAMLTRSRPLHTVSVRLSKLWSFLSIKSAIFGSWRRKSDKDDLDNQRYYFYKIYSYGSV